MKIDLHEQDFDFYNNLKSFTDFSLIGKTAIYHQVPANWWVVITDVRGSTAAIQSGRYKDVNLVGAAAITCLQNLIGHTNFPL